MRPTTGNRQPTTKITIIGGGASGLMAADFLSRTREVHIYERGKTVGRKFLVAGNGGFNLTNRATGAELLRHYSPAPQMITALQNFDTTAVRAYFSDLGIPTFIGSSGRVFPERGIKPARVLAAMMHRLRERGVHFHFHHTFVGFTETMQPIVENAEGKLILEAEKFFFALGGASWSKTGSDGKWLDLFVEKGIKTVPFQASNCGVNVRFAEDFTKKYAGTPLKNIAVRCGDMTVKGEALITEYGLEGNAIYPVVREVRRLGEQVVLHFDFKTQNTENQLIAKIKGNNIQPKNYGYAFNLTKAQTAFIKQFTTKDEYLNPILFVKKIKNLSVSVEGLRPIDEAISTVGGVAMSELNNNFSLRRFPHLYVLGEMSDWDAPTGGFLLQGCFATAYAALH